MNSPLTGIVGAACAAALLLAGCRPALEPEQPPLAAPPGIDLSADAVTYTVVPARSSLRILVWRAGRLAALGHNHVLYTEELQGEVYLPAELSRTVFRLAVPVNSLSVDDPDQRAAAGPEFSSVPDESAIAGTRANLLGESQLDAARWPGIHLQGSVLSIAAPAADTLDARLQIDIELAGRRSRVEVPAMVTLCGNAVLATASFTLRQTELGLQPFSVMLGALQVRDELDIDVRIVAQQQAAPAGIPAACDPDASQTQLP